MSLNRYAYAGANPVNFVDPSGMIYETPYAYDWCSSPRRQSDETFDCAASPSDGESICLDPKDPYGGFFSTWGVILTTGCDIPRFWTDQQKDNLRNAFRQIDSRLQSASGRGFRDVFRGLEIRHLNRLILPDQPHIGQTHGGTRIHLANRPTSSAAPASNLVNFETITHELGHVLENRTRNHPSGMGMLETAHNTNRNNVWLPSREDVAPLEARGGSGNLEVIADYFLFWVNEWYGRDETDFAGMPIAKIYMDGGWVNVIADHNCTTYPGCKPQIATGPSGLPNRRDIEIVGMDGWTMFADEYAADVYDAFADLVYRILNE